MSDAENQELCFCSDCRCTILLEKYFSKNRQGKYNKNCDSCLAKRKAQRATPEAKAKRKAYYEKNKEKIKAQGRAQSKQYYEANKEHCLTMNKKYYETNKEKHKALTKAWKERNKEHLKEKRKEYYEANKEHLAELIKAWTARNKDRVNETNRKYLKHRRDTDPVFKLTDNLRRRVNSAIHGHSKSASTMELIGCTPEFVREHLENQFTEGMTWENQGDWHVDQILPCASFDLSKPEEQKKCFNYTNLQPLWALDNIRKSDKLPDQL